MFREKPLYNAAVFLFLCMGFTEKEIEQMQAVFKHLAPNTITSIQLYKNQQEIRINATYFVKTHGKYSHIFQYFENISKYRLKLLPKIAKKVPYKLYTVKIDDRYTCIGWKFEKHGK